MSTSENTELYKAISINFELGSDNAELSLNDIKQQVRSVLRELLDKNMEKLMTILYRIDIPQNRTDEIMNRSSKDDISALLADEIIKRQLQKIETRNRYKNRNS